MSGERWPHIRIYSEKGFLVLRDGLSITFYSRHPHSQIVKGALRSLEIYLSPVEPDALGVYSGLDGYWQDLDSAAWKNICRLPTEYLEAHGPARVLELVMGLASCLPFCSGHAGLSLHAQTDILYLEKVSRAGANRYPGMDIPPSHPPTLDIGTKIDGVHWLNFLGPPVLDELGDISGLRARLHSSTTTVQEMEGGRAVVILGEWPDAGELEQGRTLPAYRELARVLEPFRYQPHYLPNEEVPEELRRWERRFLDGA